MRKEAWFRAQSETVYSINKPSTTWWSDGKIVTKEAGLRAQSQISYFTSEHSITWWSEGKFYEERDGA